MQHESPVGIVVTCCVPLSGAEAFEAGLRELIRIASRQPGRSSAEVVQGTIRREGRRHYILYRFSGEASLRAWEKSEERKLAVPGSSHSRSPRGGMSLPDWSVVRSAAGCTTSTTSTDGSPDMDWHLAPRVAGVLAIVVLGTMIVAAFAHSFRDSLAGMNLNVEIVQELESNVARLDGLNAPSGVDPQTAAAIRSAVAKAFVFGFPPAYADIERGGCVAQDSVAKPGKELNLTLLPIALEN
jgi:heme-degrading monooxygenase HmoA